MRNEWFHYGFAMVGQACSVAEQRRKTLLAGAGEIDDAAAGRIVPRRPFQFGETRS